MEASHTDASGWRRTALVDFERELPAAVALPCFISRVGQAVALTNLRIHPSADTKAKRSIPTFGHPPFPLHVMGLNTVCYPVKWPLTV